MMTRATAPLIILTLLLAVAIIGLACGGGDSVQPPTSEATPTAAPPSPTPTPTPEAEETLGHYENAELGFSFDYPSHWEQLTVGGPVAGVGGEQEDLARITVGTISGELGVSVLNGVQVRINRLTEAVEGDELDEFFQFLDDLIVDLAGQTGGVLEEKDRTELAGRKATRYVIKSAFEGVRITSEQVITVRVDLQFTVDCQGERDRFEEVRADCQVVLDSFEFTTGQ